MEDRRWTHIRIELESPATDDAPRFKVGDEWQKVKVIGRNLRGDLPDVPRPRKPSQFDGDGDGFMDLNGDGIDKEPAPVADAARAVERAAREAADDTDVPKPDVLITAQPSKSNSKKRKQQQAKRTAAAARNSGKEPATSTPRLPDTSGGVDPEVEKRYREMVPTLGTTDLVEAGVAELATAVFEYFLGKRFSGTEVTDPAEILGIRDALERATDISDLDPRITPGGREQTRQIVGLAIAESPVAQILVDKFGLPPVVLFDRPGEVTTRQDQGRHTEDELMDLIGGFYLPGGAIIALNGRMSERLPDRLRPPNPDPTKRENWAVGGVHGGRYTFRHEYGHWLLHKAMLNGTEEQRAAAMKFASWYLQKIEPQKSLRKDFYTFLDPTGVSELSRQDRELLKMLQRDPGIRRKLQASGWLSPYGHTNEHETWAEVLSMLMSPDPSVRAMVPPNVRVMVEQVLDMQIPIS